MAFWGWVKEVRWGIYKPNRAASHTARLRSGQVAGIGAGPESHGRGVNGFVGGAVGGDVAKETVGSGKIVLFGWGLIGGRIVGRQR